MDVSTASQIVQEVLDEAAREFEGPAEKEYIVGFLAGIKQRIIDRLNAWPFDFGES